MKKIIAMVLSSSLAFAQNATEATTVASDWVSPYYPLITSPYVAGTIVLVRDITIIVVLWVILFKTYDRMKGK